ncbi:D-tyrosyl-tRNA(Tyr) deacylase CYBJADRAFT_166578 [Cyberlindnera jadinii NRRL Y-1542]|uniref:D-aminoacyl-tRNA deacylase n=1 Tax=Cyberlindnera jadinii (strain ATCC 18201 / CBS 1600 / BCRC 20928 / JCM 3617 / NBRC 0987 / NRRL Y-1542) TaxID=983966 RepID=A0A1E4S5H9_CYBJN|nr:hypothetical protein CYBJADRAFT_166578 [Cyberlindnera jadinii NRRL Y-1542]ODV74797.1 hypothetical protein CYBJADRAFT_166578 [Cyberlindnera jadinii NRRL Y-1542]
MRIVIQKVKRASVTVDSEIVSSIEKGLLLLVGISTDDNERIVDAMASKVAKLRMFEDEEGKNLWKSTTRQANGQILSVSQFTLMANTKKGTKPDLHKAAKGMYMACRIAF